MVRDGEIERLVNYIKGLGLKVTFSSKKNTDAAFWYLDNSQITICKSNNRSKIETVLSLIHEIGHALHNVHEQDRQMDTKFEKAIDHVDLAEEYGEDTKKGHRKTILNSEIAGTRYWHVIYKDTNMKFPIWRLEVAMEFDVWVYQVFYETGKYPIKKVRIAKYKQLVKKHRGAK